jgi:diaminohydroxyphosphoribosylaminopyrimidine deaminase/5-amino-6-(5-phosphoribosylamino)uracil reductase
LTGEDDRRFMRRCLELARRAEGRTSPNPIVGCVIVAPDGRVIAEGWHRKAGEPHGEADAIARLASPDAARGATLYVNLEPCAHTTNRRTAPCAPIVRDAGVARVVIGMRDPFPGHGGGVELLAQAGIRVDVGVEEEACRRANEPFVVYATQKRAHFLLKAAMTLDGRIATASGESRWITGEVARREVHGIRNRMDAILVGVGTVIADDPLLTVRGIEGGDARDPMRIVLDGSLRMPTKARMLSSGSIAQTIVVTTREAPERRARSLAKAGAEIVRLAGKDGRVDLRALARWLGKREICRVLVEGGADVHAAFVQAKLCDRLRLYVAPKAIGGRDAPSWLGGDGVAKLARAHGFRFDGAPRLVGDDLAIELVPR